MNVFVCILGIQPREALTHVPLEIINKTMCVFACLCVALCMYGRMTEKFLFKSSIYLSMAPSVGSLVNHRWNPW